MNNAQRQLKPAPDADQWLTVEEAAALTSKSPSCWLKIAKKEDERARREGGPSLAVKRRGDDGLKARWHIHRSIDPRLSRAVQKAGDQAYLKALRGEYPEHVIKTALGRLACIERWLDACARRELGKTDAELAEWYADQFFGRSGRTLFRWYRAYKDHGPQGLLDRHLVPGERVTRSPEAVEFFYSLYHAEQKLSINECHVRTLTESHIQGWTWPKSYKRTREWLHKHDDLSVTCLMRQGKAQWSRRYMEHLTQDWGAIEPGEFFVSDHKQVDFFVRYKDKLIRPWLTAIMDGRSRCIVGWNLGPAPHTDAIMAAMRMAFRDWAIPDAIRLDNGRDYASKLLTGETKKQRRTRIRDEKKVQIWDRLRQVSPETADESRGEERVWLGVLPELDIDMIFAIPFHPWSKGIMERWFGTFNEQCGKLVPTWCGDKPENKPECLSDLLDDAPTLNEARALVNDYIDGRYHRSMHRGEGMFKNAPLAVWQTATALRRAEESALAMLLNIRGEYKVGGNGVSITIGGGRLSYGRSCAALKRYKGRKVLVALDPERIADAWAIDPATRKLIGRMDLNEKVHPLAGIQDAREEISEVLREQARAAKVQRNSYKRTRTAVQRINARKFDELDVRATGTDDHSATIQPVLTGFENLSSLIQKLPDRGPKPPDMADFYARFYRGCGGKPETDDPHAHISIVDLAADDSLWESNEDENSDDDHYADVDLTGLWDDDEGGEHERP